MSTTGKVGGSAQTSRAASRARKRERAQQVFLEHLSSTCQVTKAARAAGVTRTTIYAWRDDPEFAKAWDTAIERVGHMLESEAIRRAYDGTLRPVYQGGVKVGAVREFSDSLLLALLKAHGGPRYRERSDVTLTVGLADLILAQGAKPIDATCPSITCQPQGLELVERVDGPLHGPNVGAADRVQP